MSTFVFIHGAWHDGGCWRLIQERLAAQKHRAIAPNLPGHGSDQTPFHEITMQRYVDAVLLLLEQIDSTVTLVGHSFGGMVISQVAEHRPLQIAQLIYVAGFLPRDGDSFWQLSQLQKPTRYTARMQLCETTAEYTLPERYRHGFAYHQTRPEVFEALGAGWRPEPLFPLRETVHLTDSGFGVVPKRYVICSEDRAVLASTQLLMIQRANEVLVDKGEPGASRPSMTQRSVKFSSIPCDHTPFYSHPEALTQALVQPINADG